MSASLRRAEFATGAAWRPGLPPGVYEARAVAAPSRLVRLDTAAFIGLAQRGPLNTPVALDSPAAFARSFGDALSGLALPQAVAAFFGEGGQRAVVIRCMDSLRARTTRFTLPGLLPAAAMAARNPGQWANALLLRLAATRRALPLVLQVGTVFLAPEHRGIPGATLRLPGRNAGAPTWHLCRITEARAAGRGTVRLTLDPPPADAFITDASGQGAEEILVRLDIAIGDRIVERWDEAGLDWRHPRYLPVLLGRRAVSEQLLPAPVDGSDPETEAGSPDRAWGSPQDPPGSEFLRPSLQLRDAWLVPSEALLAAPDGLLLAGADLPAADQGSDAAATTGREVFLEPTSASPADLAADAAARVLVFADRPAALDALDTWDAAQPFSPIALVVLPDLLQPASPADLQAEPPPDPAPPCFGACGAAIPPVARSASPYPRLGQNLADLQAAQLALVQHCEAGGTRIALCDLPPGLTSGDIGAWRRALASDRAALYAPWLLARDAADASAAAVTLPPAAVAAGIVARVEAAIRPWAAPANQEVRSAFALAASPGLPDAGFLHTERIDAFRDTERGLMLLGSRTTSLDPDWTHLSVRRLIDWLKAQLLQDLAFAPFEPNGPVLWNAMTRSATRRLRAVLDAGGLAGASAADSFFVRCDASTTPRTARDVGQAIMLVGVAPAVPAEFIVFQLVRSGGATGTLEAIGP